MRFTAIGFTQLQEDGTSPGYNLTKDLEPGDAVSQVASAQEVFAIRPSIRDHQITQAYLVSLIVKR